MLKGPSLIHRVTHDWRYFIAFGLGSGLMPFAPGTFSTLAAIPLYLCLSYCPPMIYALVVLVAFIIGGFVCEYVSHDLKVHDYKGIVWDEFVGYWITMFLAPFKWQWIIAGFFLFRFFDIFKMGPIRYCDRYVRNGWGIMIDDVLAGVLAFIVLQLLIRGVG